MIRHLRASVAIVALVTAGNARSQAAAPVARRAASPSSAARVANVRYALTFDATTSKARQLNVAMTFDVTGDGPVSLSLPVWTPGSYEVGDFAKFVVGFDATADGRAIPWNKTSYDTWRLRPNGANTVTVSFRYIADTLDNAMAWSRPDFLLVNGTNIFLRPDGVGADFAATVTVKTEPTWRVVTGLTPVGANSWSESSYHDLVDRPLFIGVFDVDSAQIEGKWTRLATYPAGRLAGQKRDQLWSELKRMIPPESRVFGETPWDTYSVMAIFQDGFGGGSALEHANSHVGIYTPQFMGTEILASITAHEIFHAFNVKRLRPADLVPYRYDRPQPTPWLWVSEGITDYYADLALLRGGIVDSLEFLNLTLAKIDEVSQAPPVALSDASLSTWIHPRDGTATIYYPKGSLAGLLLDIIIRDASDNASGLDDVFRTLWRSTYKQGRGFTGNDWWKAVSAAARGKTFDDFAARYIDGREPYPYGAVLQLAGLRLRADTLREARLGIQTAPSPNGTRVVAVAPGSAGEAAGLLADDVILTIDGQSATGDEPFAAFRKRYTGREGATFPMTISRGTDTKQLTGTVRLVPRVEQAIEPIASPSPKQRRIFSGIVGGTVSR